MRKIVSAIVFLLLCTTLGAQVKRHEISLNAGFVGSPERVYREFFPIVNTSKPDLYDIYEPSFTSVRFSPALTLEYNYNFLKWIKGGVSASYLMMWGKEVAAGKRTGTGRVHALSFVPHVKFNAINNPHFKLYGGLGCGPAMFIVNDSAGSYTQFKFAYEIVPIGVEFAGETVYGTSEVTLGNMMLGLRLGIGFRF